MRAKISEKEMSTVPLLPSSVPPPSAERLSARATPLFFSLDHTRLLRDLSRVGQGLLGLRFLKPVYVVQLEASSPQQRETGQQY